MPVPTAYTEKELAEFMHKRLGKVAKVLQLHLDPNGPGDYEEAVTDSLLAYGTDDIATISGAEKIQRLRALALVAIWHHVITNWTTLYDFQADGSSYDRSQMFKNAQEALKLAETQALPYSSTYFARITPIDHRHDPYAVRSEDEMAGD